MGYAHVQRGGHGVKESSMLGAHAHQRIALARRARVAQGAAERGKRPAHPLIIFTRWGGGSPEWGERVAPRPQAAQEVEDRGLELVRADQELTR